MINKIKSTILIMFFTTLTILSTLNAGGAFRICRIHNTAGYAMVDEAEEKGFEDSSDAAFLISSNPDCPEHIIRWKRITDPWEKKTLIEELERNKKEFFTFSQTPVEKIIEQITISNRQSLGQLGPIPLIGASIIYFAIAKNIQHRTLILTGLSLAGIITGAVLWKLNKDHDETEARKKITWRSIKRAVEKNNPNQPFFRYTKYPKET